MILGCYMCLSWLPRWFCETAAEVRNPVLYPPNVLWDYVKGWWPQKMVASLLTHLKNIQNDFTSARQIPVKPFLPKMILFVQIYSILVCMVLWRSSWNLQGHVNIQQSPCGLLCLWWSLLCVSSIRMWGCHRAAIFTTNSNRKCWTHVSIGGYESKTDFMLLYKKQIMVYP